MSDRMESTAKTNLRPSGKLGGGGEIMGSGGPRRENHITTGRRLMRAAWWWIDRWRKSTAFTDMTAEQQGVYRNLLDELWLRDGVIPAEDRILSKISGDPEAWPRVRDVVLARFRLTPEGYRNDTHDEVSGTSKDYRESQAEKGRKGAAARWHRVAPANGPAISPVNGLRTPSPSPSPLTDSLPASTPTPQERYGKPGDAEGARRDLYAALKAATEATGQPSDELLAKASRTGNGAQITNPEGVASVPWLRTTTERLTHIASRASEAKRTTRLQDYTETDGPRPGTSEWDAAIAEGKAKVAAAWEELKASRAAKS